MREVATIGLINFSGTRIHSARKVNEGEAGSMRKNRKKQDVRDD